MLDNISKFERPLNITKVFTQVLLFMILPPVVGLPYAIYTISHGVIKKEKTDYFVFFVCIAFYLAAINATKIPGGDQVNYYVAYECSNKRFLVFVM